MLGIICGVMGGLGWAFNNMVFGMLDVGMKSAPVAGQAVDHGENYAQDVTLFMFFFGVALVIASVGLFRGRRWGWILSLLLVVVGATTGARIYSLYSKTMSELEQHEQIPGLAQEKVEKARSAAYWTLKAVFLLPTAILFGHAALTCLLLLTPSVLRRYWTRDGWGKARQPN